MNFIKKNYKAVILGIISMAIVGTSVLKLNKSTVSTKQNNIVENKGKNISKKVNNETVIDDKKSNNNVDATKKSDNKLLDDKTKIIAKVDESLDSQQKFKEDNIVSSKVNRNKRSLPILAKTKNIRNIVKNENIAKVTKKPEVSKKDILNTKSSVLNNMDISNYMMNNVGEKYSDLDMFKNVPMLATSGQPFYGENQNSNEIDDAIYELKYDPRKILAFNGEAVENFKPAEGFENPDKYIVVKREKKSIADSTADISVIDSINDRTYPGAIQLANRNLVENKPDIISCKRKPITVSVDLPGMGNDGKKVVESPTYSSVKSAVNSLLDTWNTKHASKYTIPARVSYTDSMVYSKSQLSTAFGCNLKALDKSLNIDFNSIYKGEKQVMLLAYKQIFYTVSVDAPNNPSDLFDDSVTLKELKAKGLNKDNPPAYVSNVAYGRTIYVKLETTSKSLNVKAAFKALIKNQDISGNMEYKDILNQSSFTATVLGGGAKEHNKVITKNFDEIREVIKNNAEYSPKNPGYPISYTTTFLKDNAVATINSKTDYIETTSTEFTNGKLVLDHKGGYVAQYDVNWDEVTYDKNGKEIITHKTWDGNYKDRTSHFNTEIYLKGNCRNINVKVRECTGLAWEWWRTIIDDKNLPLVKKRTINIWGTTLYPRHSVEVQ